MPSLVNRVPPGLLSLLDIKALGVNPSLLADELQPAIDVTQLYLGTVAEDKSGATAAINAVGLWPWTSGSWTVPAGEIWYLNRVCAYRNTALGAGTSYRVRLAVYDAVSNAVLAVNPTSSTGTAGEVVHNGWEGPIILTPSRAIGVVAEQVTVGTAVGFSIVGRVARLLI